MASCGNATVQLTEDLEVEKAKQNQIIASISHDIKTPLTSVMGYAERMQKSALTPERTSRYVSTIYDKAQTIRDLAEEFDDYLSCNLPGSLKKQIVTTNQLFSLLQEEYQEELTSLGVQMNLANQAPLQAVGGRHLKDSPRFWQPYQQQSKTFPGWRKIVMDLLLRRRPFHLLCC